MIKFAAFIGLLVGIAFVLTAPPEAQRVLSANEIPVLDDKPLLTSWGTTLGSLRNSVRSETKDGGPTALFAANESFGSFIAETKDSQLGTVEIAALAATAQTGHGSSDRAQPENPRLAASQLKKPATTEPIIDRVAAAQPPQRRGLFGKARNTTRGQAKRASRSAQAASRNRGFFKRLKGRNTQSARAWALGPAR